MNSYCWRHYNNIFSGLGLNYKQVAVYGGQLIKSIVKLGKTAHGIYSYGQL